MTQRRKAKYQLACRKLQPMIMRKIDLVEDLVEAYHHRERKLWGITEKIYIFFIILIKYNEITKYSQLLDEPIKYAKEGIKYEIEYWKMEKSEVIKDEMILMAKNPYIK